jgi:phytoene synthase
LAQAIVQIIASLPLDASRRRLFVPLQVLAKHGCDGEDVFAAKETPKLRAALDDMFGEARALLNMAETLLLAVSPDIRPAFLPLAQVRRDLARLSRADHDPFLLHAPSRFKILWTLWRASRSRAFTA